MKSKKASISPPYERRKYDANNVKPRKTYFEFPADIPRHWIGGSPVRTAVANSLNLFLPAFEGMIVRMTRDTWIPKLQDPRLEEQARGFLGQEAVHGKTHARYLDNMRAQGYRPAKFLRFCDWFFESFMEKTLGSSLALTITAAFEHYTDLLVALFLEGDFTEGSDPRMLAFFQWHAAEEVEHNAVMFEMLKKIHDGYWFRQLGNALGLAVTLGFVFVGAIFLLRQDGELFTRRTVRELYELFFSKHQLAAFTLKLFFHYARPGYRPDDADYAELARKHLDPAPALA